MGLPKIKVKLPGVLGDIQNEVEKGLRQKGQTDLKKDFEESHGPMWSDKPKEGNPEFVVSNTVPGAKGKNGKTGPSTTNYYRVDFDETGKATARKLDKAEVNQSVIKEAKTLPQLQAEQKAADLPASLTEAAARAARADELVGKAKNPKYERPESVDNKLNAVVQNGTPEAARDAILKDLDKTGDKLDKLSDKQMDPATKESIGSAIDSDMDKLQRAQNLPEAITAAQQAINPNAPGPKVDPLAPKVDPLAARP